VCGRFSRTAATKETLANLFDLAELPTLEPRHNIAPSQLVRAERPGLEPASRTAALLNPSVTRAAVHETGPLQGGFAPAAFGLVGCPLQVP
jgi:putative SOS response-associated peptidase YedK